MKIRPVGAEFSLADGRIMAFRNFAKALTNHAFMCSV